MSLTDWASQVARDKLESLPSRWAHVQGVARQARTLRVIAGQDAELLEAAAILHDVGHAPDIAVTGFHPLDGASYLADIGAPVRLVNLVAHHSYALLEAELRDLANEMTRFHDEHGLIRDALWYCDQTTSPFGEPVSQRNRIAEIQHRYGPGHLVTRFITGAEPELLAAVERTEQRLAAVTASQPR
jgi:HD domain